MQKTIEYLKKGILLKILHLFSRSLGLNDHAFKFKAGKWSFLSSTAFNKLNRMLISRINSNKQMDLSGRNRF